MPETTEAEKRESRRSAVRVWVTYGAASFLFGGGAALVGFLLCNGKIDMAKDLFLAILPVSAAVVTYWFANRASSKNAPSGTDAPPQRSSQG